MAEAADQTDLDYIRELRKFINPSDNTQAGSSNFGQIRELVNSVDDPKTTKVKCRFIVNINEFRAHNSVLTDSLLRHPIKFIPLFEKAAKEEVENENPQFFAKVGERERRMKVPDARGGGAGKDSTARICVGFEGNFGDSTVSPRTLCARHLSHMVCVEGIVTRASPVRPKVVKSIQYCPATGEFVPREYRDYTDFGGRATAATIPGRDEAGNALEQEFGLTTFKDSQVFTLQEMPEAAPLGQLPRSVDVYVDGDLVDGVKPGDRVAAVGVFRAAVPMGGGPGAGGGGGELGVFPHPPHWQLPAPPGQGRLQHCAERQGHPQHQGLWAQPRGLPHPLPLPGALHLRP